MTTQGKWLIRTGTEENGEHFTYVELNNDGDSIADVYGASMRETLSNAELIALAGNLNQKVPLGFISKFCDKYDLSKVKELIAVLKSQRKYGCQSPLVSKALKNIKR